MASEPEKTTIDPREAEHFGAQAEDWWDPKGKSAMLHKLQRARLGYIRDAIDTHWHGDEKTLRPLAGKRALDVGCGAGLVAEPLARMGATVTAIDAATPSIAVARAHAAEMGLTIDYRACGVEMLAGETFDLVTALEVVEHVTDPALFVHALVSRLAPGGLLILSTPNRTPLSRLAIVTLAEGLGHIARGTHDWDKFITPPEMTGLLENEGLIVSDLSGIAADPRLGFVIGRDTSINYILRASHP
jgi:2-polyprenyl-6-hydroxyphenyl methylase/3-demethylubiquinone-9 3-methyltransferase